MSNGEMIERIAVVVPSGHVVAGDERKGLDWFGYVPESVMP